MYASTTFESKLLNHWKEMLRFLFTCFDSNFLRKNNIITTEGELKQLFERIMLIKQYMGDSDDYIYIKSIDYIPVKRTDIDIFVRKNLQKYINLLQGQGFKIVKVDLHSISMKLGDMDVDLHIAISGPLARFYIKKEINTVDFYGFKIFEPRTNLYLYLVDILDKKIIDLGMILNILYSISIIKGIEPTSFIKKYYDYYKDDLYYLPWKINIYYMILLFNKLLKYSNIYTKKVRLKPIFESVKDIVFILK